MFEKVADKIVENIINDIKERNGIGDEWNLIDMRIQEDIVLEWKNIILEQLDRTIIKEKTKHKVIHVNQLTNAKHPCLCECGNNIFIKDSDVYIKCSKCFTGYSHTLKISYFEFSDEIF